MIEQDRPLSKRMAEKRTAKTISAKHVEDTTSKEQPKVESQEPLKTLTNFFTVEPILLIQMSTAILAFMVVQDFLFEKACTVNFGYSDEVCSALKTG